MILREQPAVAVDWDWPPSVSAATWFVAETGRSPATPPVAVTK